MGSNGNVDPSFSVVEGVEIDRDSSNTYESTKARRTTESLADKVNWDERYSFRGQPYRHLHHQRGLVGIFKVRLMEGRNLIRSHWSALALGPVKHLGFSKAHGAVSSFCTFYLEYNVVANENPANKKNKTFQEASNRNKKVAPPPSESFLRRSPVIPSNDSPVWHNCEFELPLTKGSMPMDGMRIFLCLRVEEDSTAVESIWPAGDGNRTLGIGYLDVTQLCLGESKLGQPLPGIQDAWIPISLPKQYYASLPNEKPNAYEFDQNDPLVPPATAEDTSFQNSINSENQTSTGRIHVLVSYEPYGMEPQRDDIVALECFARRYLPSTTCRPVLSPPLQPMKVLDRRASFLLLGTLPPAGSSNSGKHHHCIRLHRNAVFVVERQNWMDAVKNWALLPADAIASTPLGRKLEDVAKPLVSASMELFMPAILSAKLIWMAVRTTAVASVSGFQALGNTFWQEGTQALLSNQPYQNNNNNSSSSNNNNNRRYSDVSRVSSSSSNASVVQYVQL